MFDEFHNFESLLFKYTIILEKKSKSDLIVL